MSVYPLRFPAVQIKESWEVVYKDSSVYGVVGKAVILECGPTVPDMYIWSFTKPGTEAIKAVVYNLGHGPRIQELAATLGELTVISNSAAVSIQRLPLAAHGLFTCQAFYDIETEPRVYYYYVHLTVRVPVSKPYLLMSDASPVEGSTTWMRCNLENGTGPIQYVWQHETRSGNITAFAQGNSSIINVTDVNRNHTGWYRCVASNAVNSESSNRLWLDTIYGPDIPQIDVTPYSITERGYSALERETVSLLCQAQSNPASQYVWFYNNSQVYTGPQFTITKILRMHTGDYTCSAQNTYLNTRSKKTISLTVYYPPDSSPSCSVEPALNHTSLRLLCSWPGGFPSPSLNWNGDLMHAVQDQINPGQQTNPLNTNNMLLPSGGLTSNNSLFTCTGSHVALQERTQCSVRTYIPPAEPVCFAYVTNNQLYLMLSCSWDGGAPKALLWWEGPDGQSKSAEENSNILILRYGTARSGKPYTCHAKHPLLVQTKTCRLTLEAPVLLTQRRVVSVYEGSDVQLTCNLRTNYLPASEITWFNNQGADIQDTSKYTLQQTSAWANLTVRDADQTQDSGEYRCSSSNAVGGTEINVTLVVKKYPMPPNATLVRLMYNSQQRNEVELEWQMKKAEGGWTGFFLEHRWVSDKPGRRGSKVEERIGSADWNRSIILDKDVRSHTVGRLTPTFNYQFRIVPVNHRTIGYPSAAKTPAVQIKENWEVVYKDSSVYGVVGKAVILECGPTVPDMYIWSFTKPGTEAIKAVVYNLGHGPRIQELAATLGELTVISNSAAVSIQRLPLAAHGLFTCQAFYDIETEPRVYYYYVHLTVRVPVSKPYLLMSDASPVEGSTMWMRCNLENGTGPIQYVWQHETRSGNITAFAQGNSSIINVTDVNRNHTGWYRCVASNAVNSESSNRLWLDTIYGPDIPQIDVTPYSITERGYSALERETVSLLCQAQSNPVSQYVWFYNNSQVYTGPQFTITKILRMHTGDYTCLAQNTYLNTRSKKTISLTVYYPPDSSPSCSVDPALNHTSLRLLCSWPGGFPSPSLNWNGDLMHAVQDQIDPGRQTNPLNTNNMLLPSGGLTSNNSLFTCTGSHVALQERTQCSVRTYIPPAEPVCFAYVTNNQLYLMLSCSWDGGAPKALLWWEGPDGQSKSAEENSNILILRYGTARSGKPYTCHAKHPLLVQTKTCRLTLEAPVLLTQRRVVSVYEGSDVQLTCNLRTNYLPASEITWFNNQGVDIQDTSKYMLLRTSAWANLTVRDTDQTQDSGEYRCSTSNAVGGTEINVTLVVNKYPMPPNATLVKVMYNSRQRNEVELEWQVEKAEGGWTGFFLEHRWVSEKPGRRGSKNDSKEQVEERISPADWNRNIIQDPDVRSHTVGRLTPTFNYQFRIVPVNHRTIGHPSPAKTPAEPRYNIYPAVIGAAIGGMLFAAFLTLLLLVFIIRNRNNNPRLHDMLFGLQHSQSRENINFPEDEMVAGSDGGIEEIGGSSSQGPALPIPRAASPLTTSSPQSATPTPITTTTGQAPPTGDDNEPVNVTITVKATGS
ncbi:uncharacterized protein LOC114446535 [Parambassis ranga]|uniref:Uncharacterized protein LOC114446535 n=1 Tax=Parambassis ranga TaxID=210632 RepID=A0A6P7JM21_9TELE|nr:uncharacterized protein LOC114446535 [Parambassis ranga]